MQSKYNAAIVAGIAGGLLLASYAVLSLILELVVWNGWVPGIGTLYDVCGCLLLPAILVIALATGVLAVMRAKELASLSDAATIAALSGAIAGLIYEVVAVVIAFLRPVIEYGSAVDSSDLLGGLALGSLFGGAGGVLTCVCAPAWLIVTAIVAAIGGVVYASLKLKL